MKHKSIIFSILAGILLSLSFSAKNLWFFAWVGLVPLLFAIEGKSIKQSFWLSYLCGIVFFAGTVYWIIHVTLAGLIALVLYLALYFGLFGMITTLYLRGGVGRGRPARGLSDRSVGLSDDRTPNSIILIVPIAWVFMEFLRSHMLTGFGWALLGYSQYRVLPVIQIADIAGAYGVSFLIVMVNVAIWNIISKRFNPKIILPVFLILLLSIGYGYYKLNETKEGSTLKISIIQGNIPQEKKWDQDYKNNIIQKYIDLTVEASKGNPDLIIWPETALPAYFDDDEEAGSRVKELARDCGIPLLIGAATGGIKNDEQVCYNSAVLISEEGKVIETYNKLHLVPFGEFIPFERQLPFLRNYGKLSESGCFTRGSEYTIFDAKNSKFAVLVCFEDIFPGLVRRFVKKGADFMINITNDAWFKKTAAPFQHAAASVFRAIENRVPFIRAANTGLSCFIDTRGRIIETVCDKEGNEIEIAGFSTSRISFPVDTKRQPDIKLSYQEKDK